MTVRIAGEADLPAALAFFRETAATDGSSWDDEYPNEEIVSFDIKHQGLVLMTDEQGRIVSACALTSPEEFTDFDWPDGLKNPCEFARLGVLPELQGQGIAVTMIKEVFRIAKQRGYDGGHMMVSTHNEKAKEIYKRMGFTPTETVQMYEGTYELNYIVF